MQPYHANRPSNDGHMRPSFGGRKSRTKQPNIGCVIGAGLTFLALFAGAIGIVLWLRHGTGAPSAHADASAGGSVQPKVEMRDLRAIRQARTGRLFFVGEVLNNGSVPAGAIDAELTLRDKNQTVLSTAHCAPAARLLLPGEKVACIFDAQNVGAQVEKGIVLHAEPADARVRRAELVATGTSLGRAPVGHRVAGTLTNRSPFAARSIVVAASLYGVDGKVVGAAETLLTASLPPNGTTSFEVVVSDTAAAPSSFAIKSFGYAE